ncbi:ATP-binding protein [Paenibacillus sp. YYML68]|uniref:ATP-binding protein n=1 Tax=Paenibacillus sp. YYML68 TaxID=2909250 RepID=UPI00249131A2|nr:ATP-binding protein [Paenibacillus sp. YYML68]
MVKKASAEIVYHYTPSLIGRQVKAQYLPQVIGDYKENPFIEALPPIFEEEYVAAHVRRYPDYNEEQRKLGKQIRLHLVQQISDYVEVLPSQLLVEQRISRLIRHGYKARNPFFPEYVRQYHVGFKEILEAGVGDDGRNIAGVRSTAAGFAIIGVSGQGKTTAIESSLLLYPQVIHHSNYNEQPFVRKQLVWLKLNCPHDGSIKGLCLNFFQAVDSILGTDYFRKFVSNKSSVDVLIPMMAHVSTLHGLGVLVIDEIQNLSSMKSGGAEPVLNFFTQLINTIGVPVIPIGTFKAMKLLSGSFSQARRSTGQGDMIIDRLTDGDEWDYFIQGLWKYQWTATPTKLSEAIKKTLYELSQGIVDIAVKLYMLSQWEVIMQEDERERITVGVLKEVADRHMRLVQPLLKALKRNDPSAKMLVDDLRPTWDTLDEFLQMATEKVGLQGEVRKMVKRDEKAEMDHQRYLELVKTALDFGAAANFAETIAERVLHRNENEMSIVALRRVVLEELELHTAASDIVNPQSDSKSNGSSNSRGKKNLKKERPVLEVDDLRNAAKDSRVKGEELYEKMVEQGDVVPTEEDLSRLII